MSKSDDEADMSGHSNTAGVSADYSKHTDGTPDTTAAGSSKVGGSTAGTSEQEGRQAESRAPETSVRAARRAQREAERAARAQRKADAARQRALDAARAGGLFEGTESASVTSGGAVSTVTAPAAASGSAAVGASAPAKSTAPVSYPVASGNLLDPGRKPGRQPMDHGRQVTLMVVLSILSVLLLAVAGLATWQYFEARDATLAEEQIANARTEATDAAREVATQMFTYDHRTVDADLAAVRARLTNPALGEFVEQSMPTVASAAKQQEATVYATVAAAAPQDVVDQDNVKVLVMLNRMVSTKDAPEAASSASRLSMEMKRDGDTWKLAKLNAL